MFNKNNAPLKVAILFVEIEISFILDMVWYNVALYRRIKILKSGRTTLKLKACILGLVLVSGLCVVYGGKTASETAQQQTTKENQSSESTEIKPPEVPLAAQLMRVLENFNQNTENLAPILPYVLFIINKAFIANKYNFMLDGIIQWLVQKRNQYGFDYEYEAIPDEDPRVLNKNLKYDKFLIQHVAPLLGEICMHMKKFTFKDMKIISDALCKIFYKKEWDEGIKVFALRPIDDKVFTGLVKTFFVISKVF